MKNNLFIAVVLSLSGLFLLDCMGIAIKYLREDYPAAQLSVFRNLFGMIPCFIVLYFGKINESSGITKSAESARVTNVLSIRVRNTH